MATGTVFNIQHYSVNDGPGIRTVVFFKGCPLRCGWCANPESQNKHPELAWSARECIGCGECQENLSCYGCSLSPGSGVHWNNDVIPDGDLVKRICPSTALHVIGETMSTEEVLNVVLKDMVFYQNSMGGITLSGGEPLMQFDFAVDILKKAREHHIHTAIETCGFVPMEHFLTAAKYLDYVNMDIKSLREEKHKEHTGAPVQPILENFKALKQEFPELPVNVRTPVIPGFNDSKEELQEIYDFVRGYENVTYEPLRYHRLGLPKYESLRRKYPMGDAELSQERFRQLTAGIL